MTILSLWMRRTSRPERPAAARFVAAIELEATLMRAHPWDGMMVPCGWRAARWFLEVPAGWRGDRERLRGAVGEILHIESRRLSSAEGHALSYLVLGRTVARPLAIDPGRPVAWEQPPLDLVWERSNCWASADTSDPECWVPLSPRQFTLLGFLRRADEAALSVDQFADLATSWFAIRREQACTWYHGRHQLVSALLEVGQPASINGG